METTITTFNLDMDRKRAMTDCIFRTIKQEREAYVVPRALKMAKEQNLTVYGLESALRAFEKEWQPSPKLKSRIWRHLDNPESFRRVEFFHRWAQDLYTRHFSVLIRNVDVDFGVRIAQRGSLDRKMVIDYLFEDDGYWQLMPAGPQSFSDVRRANALWPAIQHWADMHDLRFDYNAEMPLEFTGLCSVRDCDSGWCRSYIVKDGKFLCEDCYRASFPDYEASREAMLPDFR